MKTFLLVAGHSYYPCSGTGDWIGAFETEEEALAEVTTTDLTWGRYRIRDSEYDWHDIIDLKDWML